MTIREFIRHLEVMDQDMMVLQTRRTGAGNHNVYYETFDGWWPQFVTVARSDAHEGIYREAVSGEEALTI